MITKTKNITIISFKHTYVPIINISEKTEDQKGTDSLPLQFLFNGNWKIIHKCPRCGESCSIGYRVDRSEFPFFFNEFQRTRFLCDKYFNKKILENLNQLFNCLELCYLDNKMYLVKNGSFNKNFPLVSSAKAVYGNCNNCNSQYIGIVKISYPIEPEKNIPTGKPGLVEMDELIHVHVSDGLKLVDYFSINNYE